MRELPDNHVEYFLFLLDGEDNARKQLLDLEKLQKAAHYLRQTLTKDYIWQRDDFELELEAQNGTRQPTPLSVSQTLGSEKAPADGTVRRSAILARHDRLW